LPGGGDHARNPVAAAARARDVIAHRADGSYRAHEQLLRIRTMTEPSSPFLPILKNTLIALVRQDQAELTARQLAVMLICSLGGGPHTVGGLAGHLRVGDPSISRAVDRLEILDFVVRVRAPANRRSVNVACTRTGAGYVEHLCAMLQSAAAVE
jgi:DNA-binding MarR family transcriptional regulator